MSTNTRHAVQLVRPKIGETRAQAARAGAADEAAEQRCVAADGVFGARRCHASTSHHAPARHPRLLARRRRRRAHRLANTSLLRKQRACASRLILPHLQLCHTHTRTHIHTRKCDVYMYSFK
jgi:hypothetical protein